MFLSTVPSAELVTDYTVWMGVRKEGRASAET